MEFSWEALAGAAIAIAMLGVALYRRVSTRNKETAVPVNHTLWRL